MSRLDRQEVLDALGAEDVIAHLGIADLGEQRWRGRWMRARRCARADHGSEAFGIARDGHWHCHACDEGGDLISLIAVSEGLSLPAAFPEVLAIAAEIAGIAATDEPPPLGELARKRERKVRAPLPPQPSIEQREATARQRAAWVWERLWSGEEAAMPAAYLRFRGLDPAIVLGREDLRSTPLRITQKLRDAIQNGDPSVSQDVRTLWATMGTRPGTLSMVVPVRAVNDGGLVDLRARRLEPAEGQPKIVGMVGGITSAPAEKARPRRLIGCYGRPHLVDSDHVIVVEGALDYLTALQAWPNCQVLGAVEAGTFSLVAAHAARLLAERDDYSGLTIVQQADPPRVLRDGRVVAGAADQATNEEPNAALKVALRHLGAGGRVQHLDCRGATAGAKDLNDLHRQRVDLAPLIRLAL